MGETIDLKVRCRNCFDEQSEHDAKGRCTVAECTCKKFEPVTGSKNPVA